MRKYWEQRNLINLLLNDIASVYVVVLPEHLVSFLQYLSIKVLGELEIIENVVYLFICGDW